MCDPFCKDFKTVAESQYIVYICLHPTCLRSEVIYARQCTDYVYIYILLNEG